MDARVAEFSTAEAKARFSELLARAEAGEEIIIRRHGKAIAKLSSFDLPLTVEQRRKARQDYIAWRAEHGPRLGPDLTIRQLIDEGRKY